MRKVVWGLPGQVEGVFGDLVGTLDQFLQCMSEEIRYDLVSLICKNISFVQPM
jgi:hypothetical protein